MKNNKNKSILMLIITFLIVVIIFACLLPSLLFSNNYESVIINGVMLLLAFILFSRAYFYFKEIDSVTKELKIATEVIKNDFEQNHEDRFLWYCYKDNYDLFNDSIIKPKYVAYLDEMSRIECGDNNSFKCSIDHYINDSLIDNVIHKAFLNLIPGTMTGLGILGTFLGLSLALQQFNIIGSSEAIEGSIGLLMDGIKVAFHTSMYGMILSLGFNFAFRDALDDAYVACEKFLNAYTLYVIPDAETENAIRVQSSVDALPAAIAEALHSEFAQLNDSINSFATNMGNAQMEGMEELIQGFMEGMNESLNGSFENLGKRTSENKLCWMILFKIIFIIF